MKILNLTEQEKQKILGQHFPKRLNEDFDDVPYEKGPRGVRAARSRADYTPAGNREVELGSELFGKYSEEVPPIVLRYIRKNPRLIIKRLKKIYGDKLNDFLSED